MNGRFYFIVLATTLLATACNQRTKATATIFERKHLVNNQLQIKYTYQFKETRFIDSVIIKNQVLKGDSITVSFSAETPAESFTDLQK